MMDFIELEDGYAIVKTRAPRSAVGRTLAECGWRSEHGFTVVGVKQTLISEGDLLIVAGATQQVEAFASKN